MQLPLGRMVNTMFQIQRQFKKSNQNQFSDNNDNYDKCVFAWGLLRKILYCKNHKLFQNIFVFIKNSTKKPRRLIGHICIFVYPKMFPIHGYNLTFEVTAVL